MKWLASHTTSLMWKRQTDQTYTMNIHGRSRFIPPLTESNVTYALFAWVDLWFIGTSVTYEVFRCLHDPLLANLCFRVKIQKWASIKSAAGSIKNECFGQVQIFKMISKTAGNNAALHSEADVGLGYICFLWLLTKQPCSVVSFFDFSSNLW